MAVDAFHAGGDVRGGSGVVVLPCGAGKTIVGIAALAALGKNTLVLTTSTTSVEQWHREILDKTDLDDSMVATYTGESKEIAPVTLATYQIVTYRPKKDGDFPHFTLFNERDWGLIIYDEVHLLPAPVFRVTADIQARRRLGLTATLVREDGREEDVFSLIGPKKYDVPWRVLEQKGWIAEALCHEVRLALPADEDGWNTPSPSGATSSAWPARTPPRTTSSRRPARPPRRPRRPRPDHRPVPQAAPPDRRPVRPAAHHRPDRATPSAKTSTAGSAAARSAGWSSRRSATSPSTCPTPT